MGPMDARTLARIARVNIGTFNVWAHRGFLPGLEPGVRGRRRNIGQNAATRILIFAELVRFGVWPDDASRMVSAMTDATTEEAFLLVPAPEFGGERKSVPAVVVQLVDLADIARMPRLPSVSLLINVRDLAARVRQAEHEWEQSRELMSRGRSVSTPNRRPANG